MEDQRPRMPAAGPVPDLADLLQGQLPRRFNRKAIVIRPEAEPDWIYYVVEGKLRLYMLDSTGKEFTINFLEAGDLFPGHTRCFGEALTDVAVLTLSRQAFGRLVEDRPEVYARLVPLLGNSLRTAFDIIEGLVFKACSSRLAWFLLSEAELRGTSSQQGVLIEMPLHTEHIGTRIGATRQTTSMLLNDLERKGVLQRQRSRWLITDIGRLRQLSTGTDE